MAVVAIAAIGHFGVIGPRQASSILSNGFALSPITYKLTVRWPLDAFEILRFNGLAGFVVQALPGGVSFTASAIGFIGGGDAFDMGNPFCAE